MTDVIVVPQAAHWQRLKRLVLDSVSSPITRRVYNLGLDEFFEWYGEEPRPGFTKATVCAWRVALEARGLGAVSINVRITAVRKLAVEAADNGLLAPELANGITRVKGVASKGVRLGNWLTVRQAQTLLNTPDTTTTKGLRDRAILAVLLGCGLRRSEVAALTVGHVQQRDGRWCIVDLVGKHGRVRTVPMPTWVKVAIDAWTSAAGVADGYVFRPVNRAGKAQGVGLSEKVVWQLLQPYATAAGVPGIAPHDLRRNAECRIMPNRFQDLHLARSLGDCGPTRFGMIGEGYRPFRKASSSSSGRYRILLTSIGAVLLRARSFKARSASREICVVSTDSCPSQSAITARSTPACNNSIAAVCLNRCGLRRLVPRVEQVGRA